MNSCEKATVFCLRCDSSFCLRLSYFDVFVFSVSNQYSLWSIEWKLDVYLLSNQTKSRFPSSLTLLICCFSCSLCARWWRGWDCFYELFRSFLVLFIYSGLENKKKFLHFACFCLLFVNEREKIEKSMIYQEKIVRHIFLFFCYSIQ